MTAAFGQILSQKVLDIPVHGTVNVHASLLPAYRGPAPINWCLINGEKTTGVTTMMTDRGIDTGDILLCAETAIGNEETAPELSQRLSLMGASLLVETLRRLQAGTCPRILQNHELASRHPMLTKELGCIRFQDSAVHIANLVRGVVPWPGAYTPLPAGGTLRIWKARAVEGKGTPGEVVMADAKKGLRIACGEGLLEVLELQAPGSKRMSAVAYLLGHPIPMGTMFA